ncbi:hypothetical protein HLB44_02565 [Aquincola sp. S2]|uniref:Protein kinase domain-containing protein n=1 Tax=Pseudaquabacterium terrae TaxID=2732868 RepID=A0ABX2ECZ8_9BURK|nr:hypothetical protein [Aquabacterium terrae]NRF65863.1 hypothetical protein [Aquabacterium terrae]
MLRRFARSRPMNAPDPLPPAADGAAPPGHRLGHFELRGVVATGENDVVYRAWDLELGIPVAIKEYLPRRLIRRNATLGVEALDVGAGVAFEGGREAFHDEARQLARCDHASLLRVRHLVRAHGTVYRVMPWYGGWPLHDLRREMAAPPDESALRRLLLELLGALESWHRVAGAHGGVNPARILLLDDDRALLLGPRAVRQGVADEPADSPAAALADGFMAPEMREPSADAPTGPWSDFFALAQVARFCITGMLPPAPGASVVEPLAQTVQQLYFDAPDVRYAENLLNALDAAASPHIGLRPRTAAEFRAWLDHGPRPADAASVPVVPPAATAPQALEPHPAIDEILLSPGPVASAAAPAPAASAVAPSEGKEQTPDAATVDLIRRVIEVVPEREAAPLPPSELPPDAPADRPFQADIRPALAPTVWPRRPSAGRWWLVGALLLAAIGYGATQTRWLLDRRGEGRGAAQPAPSSGATPEASVVAMSAAIPAPPATAVQPAARTDAPVEVAESAMPADAGASSAAAPESPAGPTQPSQAADTAADPVPARPLPRAAPDNPRQACGERTQFSLYRCMQQQCASAAWKRHPQCLQLGANDRVD